MGGRCWWFLLLACLGSLSLTEAFVGVSMYPEGPLFILRGDPLSINCTVTTGDSSTTAYNLSVNLIEGSTGQRRELGNVSTYYPEAGTVSVNIPETTLEDNGTYMCNYEGMFKSLKVVSIGERPKPPKSIHCVSLNFKQMTCYVELSQKETYIPTNWTMEYRTRSLAVTLPCSKYNTSYLYCGNITGPSMFRLYANYSLTVTGYSEDFNITLQNITYVYTDLTIVKPGPVRDLSWTVTDNSSVIILNWRFPGQLGPRYINLSYKVDVRSQEDWDHKVLFVGMIPSNPDVDHVYSYTLHSLIPYANYTVSLSAKPVTSRGDWYWSEPETITLTTDSDVPGASVSMVSGSYYALKLEQNYISTVVYWKNPSRRLSHGQITGYQLTLSQILSEAVQTGSSTEEPASHNALPEEVTGIVGLREADLRVLKVLNETGRRSYNVVGDKMLKNESYLLEVRAGTEKGFSDAVSGVVIQPWNKVKLLHPHRVIVELDKDSHVAVVSWQMTQNISCERGLQETVYWCTVDKIQGNQSFALCQDDFEWQTINTTGPCSNQTQKISLPAEKDLDNLQFGVSMAINSVSGGILWESCRFDAMFHAPDIPLYRVDPVQDKHTELQIRVLYENCYSKDGGKPTSYQLMYKQFTGESTDIQCPEGSNTVSYSVDFDNPVMYLSNLKAGTQYVLCLRAINRYHTGNYGKPAVVRTSAPEKENVTWIWVSFGVVPGILLLIVFSGWMVRYVRKRTRPPKISDILPNNVPDVGTKDRESQNGNGTDSGVHSNNSEQSSRSAPPDFGAPILAQAASAVIRNSRTPTPDRERKISPPLPGYQSIQHIGSDADIDYEVCERSSLLDDEDPGGVDNDLNIEITKEALRDGGINNDLKKIRNAGHVYIDIEDHEENMERALEVDDGNDNEFDLSDDDEYGKESVKYEKELVKYSRKSVKSVKEIGNERNDEVFMEVTENGNKNNETGVTKDVISSADSDKTMQSAPNQEYVEEEDMQKLAAKPKIRTLSHLEMDNSVAAKTLNDVKNHYSNDDSLAGIDDISTSVGLKEFTKAILNPFSKTSDSDINSGLKNSSLVTGLKSEPSVINNQDEIITTTELSDDKSNKTTKLTLNSHLPNGLILRQIVTEKDDNIAIDNQATKVQLENNSSNVINAKNTPENFEADTCSLSDVDHLDDDTFKPSLVCGDGELTEILEALTNCRNEPDFVDLGPDSCINGYIDHDQISICSFASTASSVQDRATPERKVSVRQGSEHSSVAASPVLPRVTENGSRQGSEHSSIAASPVLPRVSENVYKVDNEIDTASRLRKGRPHVLEASLKNGIEVETRKNEASSNQNVRDSDLSTDKDVALKEMLNLGINKEMKGIEIDKQTMQNGTELELDKNIVDNGIDIGLDGKNDISRSGTGSGTGISSYVHVTAKGNKGAGDGGDQLTHL